MTIPLVWTAVALSHNSRALTSRLVAINLTATQRTPLMDFDAYSRIPAVNWSTLKEIERSPLHYQYRLSNPKPDTKEMALGRAVHAAVFEAFRLATDFVVFDGPVRRGKRWDEFQAENDGKTILSPADWVRAEAIRDAVQAHGALSEYLQSGVGEYSIRWTDAATGIDCKARLDWNSRSRPANLDIKTTTDISEAGFARQIARMRYHCQAAYYTDGWEEAQGERLPWVFVAIEAHPPHDIALYQLDEDSLYNGTETYRDLLQKLAICRETDKWPGQVPEQRLIRLPPWCWQAEEDDTGGLDLDFGDNGGVE